MCQCSVLYRQKHNSLRHFTYLPGSRQDCPTATRCVAFYQITEVLFGNNLVWGRKKTLHCIFFLLQHSLYFCLQNNGSATHIPAMASCSFSFILFTTNLAVVMHSRGNGCMDKGRGKHQSVTPLSQLVLFVPFCLPYFSSIL